MQKNQKYYTIKKKIGFTLIEALTILGIKRNTEGNSLKYLIDNKDKNNVIMSKIEGSHNNQILRSLRPLRMTNKVKELINLSTYPLINFQKAFTLAEILITLGIIGIVAAMTIPALMTHFQQEQTVTKLKKALSVINQAYRLSYDDVGEPENAFYIGSEEYFKNYWAPYIKVLTYCKNCKMCGYNSNGPFKFIDGRHDGTALVMGNARTTFLTMDGFLYIIATAGNNAGTLVPVYWVVVDINGGKGPNRWGKDVFWLERISDGQGVQPQCYKLSNRDVNNGCKTGQGACCAEKIRRAGWKIEKDYPWK